MLVGDLKGQFGSWLRGNKDALVRSNAQHVRITVDSPKHHSNPTIHTEPKHRYDRKVEIGHFVSVASGCRFLLSGNHDWQRVTTFLNPWVEEDTEGLLSNGDIIIGNDVWIGMDCIIMSGVKIGDGAVIAAGTVVSKNVEPYTIVGGTPMKVLRKRFDNTTIARLKESKWWELPIETLQQHQDLLFSRNVEEFLDVIETLKK